MNEFGVDPGIQTKETLHDSTSHREKSDWPKGTTSKQKTLLKNCIVAAKNKVVCILFEPIKNKENMHSYQKIYLKSWY